LKENHIAAVGGILQAVTLARGTAPHGLKIEIEVRNLVEYSQALDAGAEVIMLDNFKIEDIKKAVSLKRPGVLLEVSGGVTEESISALAETGVDIISVGGITHSPKNFDLSLLEATLTR
jgi:nicotinate-nucleotide pyrophosphorylase (carboxylating)